MLGAVTREHLRRIGLSVAIQNLHLLGAPFLCGFTEFGRDELRIDQLLGEAWFGEYECRKESQARQGFHRGTSFGQKNPAVTSTLLIVNSNEASSPRLQNVARD
jgi:hypothetical protein